MELRIKKYRLFIILGMLFCASLNTSYAMGQLFFESNTSVGQKATDFTLKNAEGQDVNMTTYRDGQEAILFFWATWCPHCRKALKDFNERVKELEAEEIKIILIDVGEEAAVVRNYLNKNNIPLEVLLDSESAISSNYSVLRVPTFILIDRDGVIKAIEHLLPEDYKEILKG